jgi:AcrR family transcriptional regulator
VASALQLFAEKGFRGTTTREIAAAVGVTEPVLYEHFKTKRDLYNAILDEKSQQRVALTAELTELAGRNDDRAFFLYLANLILSWYQKDREFARLLLFSGLEGHEMKDLFFERVSSELFSMIAGYIQKRINAGSMRPIHPVIATLTFFGMLAHYGQSRMIFGCAGLEFPEEAAPGCMVDIFLKGVRADGGAQQ